MRGWPLAIRLISFAFSMIKCSRITLMCIVMLLFFSCKKDGALKNEDVYVDQPEQLSELKVENSSAGYTFIEVQWSPVINTHFKAVTYSLYLDDQKIVDGLTTNKYSFINLKAGQSYSIKVVAATSEGKQIQQSLTANTLALPSGPTRLPQDCQRRFRPSAPGAAL